MEVPGLRYDQHKPESESVPGGAIGHALQKKIETALFGLQVSQAAGAYGLFPSMQENSDQGASLTHRDRQGQALPEFESAIYPML